MRRGNLPRVRPLTGAACARLYDRNADGKKTAPPPLAFGGGAVSRIQRLPHSNLARYLFETTLKFSRDDIQRGSGVLSPSSRTMW